MGRRVLIDMTGVRHGRLLGIPYAHRGPSGHAHWRFLCDCGTMVTLDGSRVRSGNTTSSGCRHRELSAARLLVHGHRAAKRHDGTFRALAVHQGRLPQCGIAPLRERRGARRPGLPRMAAGLRSLPRRHGASPSRYDARARRRCGRLHAAQLLLARHANAGHPRRQGMGAAAPAASDGLAGSGERRARGGIMVRPLSLHVLPLY